MLVAVATTFVRLARSKIVSGVITSRAGSTRAIAVSLPPHDASFTSNEHDRARQFFIGNSLRRSPHPSATTALRRVRLIQDVQWAPARATLRDQQRVSEIRKVIGACS